MAAETDSKGLGSKGLGSKELGSKGLGSKELGSKELGSKELGSKASTAKMYFVVNTDLKMDKGKMCGQVGHATAMIVRAMESGNAVPNVQKAARTEMLATYNQWWDDNQPKIVLKGNLETLRNVALEKGPFLCVQVHDAGKTQIPAGSLTVVGISPVNDANKPAILKSLKLL